MSLAERIVATDDLDRVAVDIPEWESALDGAQLYARQLSGEDQMAIAALEGDEFEVAVFVVVRTLVDEAGQRVFSDEDADALKGKSATVILRLAQAAGEVSGLTEDLEETAGN